MLVVIYAYYLHATSSLSPACGIKCYECVHNNQRVKRPDRFVYPCSEFDESDRYIMDCPDSRLCIYQRITLPLSSGVCLCGWGGLPACNQCTRFKQSLFSPVLSPHLLLSISALNLYMFKALITSTSKYHSPFSSFFNKGISEDTT